jgi:hypothetical protein
MSIDKYIMNKERNIEMNDSCKNALLHFKLDKHSNIKKSLIKKYNIVLSAEEVLNNLCFAFENTNDILLDYRYFKCFISQDAYDSVFSHFYNLIKKILETNNTFTIHVYIKSLSLIDIDKYYTFIGKISQIMKDAFPDKLYKCYIYNASFIFSQLIKIISRFVDKKTQDKIQLIDE